MITYSRILSHPARSTNKIRLYVIIAPRSEYEFQLIGSLSVGLLVRMLLRAGIVFLKNFIKDK